MTTILIVDDDDDFRSSLARDMELQGHCAIAASSCDAAISALHERAPIDVVLTDLRMPDRDGLDLLEIVHRESPETSLIMMSAFATARDYQAALELGSVEVLSKPFTRVELREAISRALECRRGFHGTIHGLGLVDILQMFHVARRSATVHLDAGERIHIDRGEIIHAESDGETGAKALASLLGRSVGHLRTSPLEPNSEQTVTGQFEQLILEIAARRDEHESGKIHDADWAGEELDFSALDDPGPSSDSGGVEDAGLAELANSLMSDGALERTRMGVAVIVKRISAPSTVIVRGGSDALSLAPTLDAGF